MHDTRLTNTPFGLTESSSQAEWEALAQVSKALLQNGTILGFNLGDELVWNCLEPAQLLTMANAVRASFPRYAHVRQITRTTAALRVFFLAESPATTQWHRHHLVQRSHASPGGSRQGQLWHPAPRLHHP